MSNWKDELQVIIPRDRVHIDFELETDTYAPGDDVVGTLRVDIAKTVEITAIRIHLVGKEKWNVGGDGKAEDREFYHLERLITVFGFSKESKRRTGAELAEGTYRYPFSLNIPIEAPPSYAMRLPRKSAFYSRLTYKLTASVVIPYSTDRKVQRELTVLSVIPQQQYRAAADTVKVLGKTELEVVNSSSCCASKARHFLEVTATSHPYYILLPTENTITRNETHSTVTTAATRDDTFTDSAARDAPTEPTAATAAAAGEPEGFSKFDSARKGDGAMGPNRGVPASTVQYTRYDSARKDGGGAGSNCRGGDHNGDRNAAEPVADTAATSFYQNKPVNIQVPVSQWPQENGPLSSSPPTQNHTSALSDSERLASRDMCVNVTVFNSTSKDVDLIRLTLTQHRSASSGNATEHSHQAVLTRDIVPSPPLHPGERRSFESHLTFTCPMRTHEDDDKKTASRPVPCMNTNTMRASDVELAVSFPKVKNVAGTAILTNVCAFASDVSREDKLPKVPARFIQPFVFPEVSESAL